MMSKIVTFLFGLVISFTLINIFYKNRIENIALSSQREVADIDRKKEYLDRNLSFNTSIDNRYLNTNGGKKFVAYYSGGSCFSCLERMLTLLRLEYELKNDLYVLVDDSSKIYNVEGYNDTFDQNFEMGVSYLKIIDAKNEIILFELEEDQIISALEFKPEEEDLFKTSFEKLILPSANRFFVK